MKQDAGLDRLVDLIQDRSSYVLHLPSSDHAFKWLLQVSLKVLYQDYSLWLNGCICLMLSKYYQAIKTTFMTIVLKRHGMESE